MKHTPRARTLPLLFLGLLALAGLALLRLEPRALPGDVTQRDLGGQPFTVATLADGESISLTPHQHTIVTCPATQTPQTRWITTAELAEQNVKVYQFSPDFSAEKSANWAGSRFGYVSTGGLLTRLQPGRTYYVRAQAPTSFRCSENLASAALSDRVVLYVSPTGNDAYDGRTEDQAVRTLNRVRDIVRTIKSAGVTSDVLVLLRGGTYENAGLDLTSQDSAASGSTVTWRKYPGETPRLLGGERVSGWQDTGSGIYRTYVGTGRTFDVLLENGKFMLNARHPNDPFALNGQFPSESSWVFPAFFQAYPEASPSQSCGGVPTTEVTYTEIGFNTSRALDKPPAGFVACFNGTAPAGTDCAPPSDIVMSIWPAKFLMNMSPLKSVTVSAGTGVLSLANPVHSYCGMERSDAGGYLDKYAYALSGHRAFLDAPGEYYYNRRTGYLEVKPRSLPIEDEEIIVPTRDSVIALRGTPMNPVRGITIDGLTIMGSDFFSTVATTFKNPAARGEGVNVLSDYYYTPDSVAGVLLMHTQNVTIRDSVIDHVGGRGISMAGRAEENLLIGNTIRDSGAEGIFLNGDYYLDHQSAFSPPPAVESGAELAFVAQTYFSKRNSVLNNTVTDVGQLYRGAVGITINQSGENRIANNLIRGSGYAGIRMAAVEPWTLGYRTSMWTKLIPWRDLKVPLRTFMYGRDNVIERNDISKFMRDTIDGGAIYKHETGPGNVFLENGIHDPLLGFQGTRNAAYGIYFDGAGEYAQAIGNVLYDVHTGDTLPDCSLTIGFNGGCMIPMTINGRYHYISNNIVHRKNTVHPIQILNTTAEGDVLTKNIFVATNTSATLDYQLSLSGLSASTWPVAAFQTIDRNMLYHTHNTTYRIGIPRITNFLNKSPVTWAEWLTNSFGFEANGATGINPLFMNAAANDFRLQPGSPALARGITSIPMDKIGLRSDDILFLGDEPRPFTNTPDITVRYVVGNGPVKTQNFHLTEGENTITITDTNRRGETVTRSFTTTLDTVAPVITLAAPVSQNIGTGNYLNVSYTVDGAPPYNRSFGYFSIGTFYEAIDALDWAGNQAIKVVQSCRPYGTTTCPTP